MNKMKRFLRKLHYQHKLNYHLDMYKRINHAYRFHHARQYHDEMADYYFKELMKLDERANDH